MPGDIVYQPETTSFRRGEPESEEMVDALERAMG